MGLNLTVLTEDTDVVVVDKPAGVPAIPDRAGQGDDVYSTLAGRTKEKRYIVHRLDRPVSGVLLFAKNPAAHRFLNHQFASRAVTKTYLALVHGHPRATKGCLDFPLGPFGSGRMGVDRAQGKPSQTIYRLLETIEGYALLEVQPITGRRHQIRVHLYAAGHPIVGDERYGDRQHQRRYPRVMLHAAALELALPGGKDLHVTAAPPPLFQSVLDQAKAKVL